MMKNVAKESDAGNTSVCVATDMMVTDVFLLEVNPIQDTVS